MESGPQAIRVLHRRDDGSFEDVDVEAAGLKVGGHAVACAVGDYDADNLNDLAVALDDGVRLFRNLGKGKFQDVTAEAGLAPHNKPAGISFIDFDHDGDLDLMLTGESLKPGDAPNVLWRNNGNKTFTEWTAPTGLGGSGATSAVILTDFNNDRAVDFAVTGDGPAPVLFVNPREGKYPTQPLYENEKLPKTVGIAVLDYNKDGWMDIAVTHAGAPGVTLWRNVPGPQNIGRHFERVTLPLAGALRGWGVTPVDIDNDGWIDLAAIVETSAGPRLKVLRNRGDGSFEDVSHALGLDNVALKSPRGIDCCGRGWGWCARLDCDAVERSTGAASQRRRQQESLCAARSERVCGQQDRARLKGGDIREWTVAEVGTCGRLGISDAGSAAACWSAWARRTGIDLLRILWPTGILAGRNRSSAHAA